MCSARVKAVSDSDETTQQDIIDLNFKHEMHMHEQPFEERTQALEWLFSAKDPMMTMYPKTT